MEKILELDFSILCDIGQQRENNEDYTAHYVPEKEIDKQKSGSLFIVADGVGGAAKGEIASKYAAETVIYKYYQNPDLPLEDRLKKAYQKANCEIYEYADQNFSQMATTMVAAVALQNQLIVANVGDSRAYLIRGGKIKQISRDHTIGAELKHHGGLAEGETPTEKAGNTLTRSIGGEARVIVDVFKPIPLLLGDKILLCSDGLNKGASDANLLQLSKEGTPEEITNKMFNLALRNGSKDNIAVILAEMVQKSGMKQKKKYLFRRKREPDLDDLKAAGTDRPQIATKRTKRRKHIPILLGFIAIAVVGALIWTLINKADVRRKVKEGIAKQKLDEIYATQTAESLSQEEAASSANAQASTPPITDEMGLVPLPTKSFDEDPSGYEWNCLYQFTEEGIFVGPALRKFGIEWKNENTYEGHTSCDTDEDDFVVDCSAPPIKYTNEDGFSVKLNWWLHVSSNPPDNWKPEDCTNNGGHIQIINPISQAEEGAGEPLAAENPGPCIGKGLNEGIEVRKEADENVLPYPWTIAWSEEVELQGWDTSYAWIYIRKLDTGQVGWVLREHIYIDPSCTMTQK